MVESTAGPRRGRPFGKVARRWWPLLPVTVIAVVLAWLNRSPWWGWALVAALLIVLGATARWWLRGPVVLKAGAWLLAGVLVAAVAVVAYPSPQRRVAGGDDPRPSAVVPTREGPVQGVSNDAGTVDIFAGIPYAQPPVGDLRWRPPKPPAPRPDVFVADRFSDVPVQGSSNFFIRALTRVVEIPLEKTFVNSYRPARTVCR